MRVLKKAINCLMRSRRSVLMSLKFICVYSYVEGSICSVALYLDLIYIVNDWTFIWILFVWDFLLSCSLVDMLY